MNKKKKQPNKGSINYPIGDFLIRLKNASIAGHKEVPSVKSKLILAVSECLKKEGYLDSVTENDHNIVVGLAFRRKEPVLMDVKIVSKPGLRVYMGAEDVEKKKGPSILILSTSKGIMTAKNAIKLKIGGELIAEVY